MDKGIFVDTWGWLTLRDRREKYHIQISQLFHDHISQKKLIEIPQHGGSNHVGGKNTAGNR